MARILILMRHGKAKRPAEGTEDFDRQLTEHGKRALETVLPRSLAIAREGIPGASLEVWSSPAARAMETARAFRKACKKAGVGVEGDVRPADSLWSQDADAFLGEVRACGSEAVAAVGHNPFVEELVERLTGSRIDFATGAFAAVELDGRPAGSAEGAGEEPGNSESGPDARLLWFVQGPVSQRWETLIEMEKALRKAGETVATRRDAFLADPDDIETLHKLRTSIRTLRSLLAFVKPWQDAGQNATAQADLKEVVAVTSRQRELDVLREQALGLCGEESELAAYLAEAAADERGRVLKDIGGKRARKLVDRTAEALADVRWRGRIAEEGLDAAVVRARFDRLAAELEDELEALDISDVEKTHDVRKGAKRIRYDAERFGALIGEDAVDIAKGMTARQDDLGTICDARVNIAIIDAWFAQGVPEGIIADLIALREESAAFLRTLE